MDVTEVVNAQKENVCQLVKLANNDFKIVINDYLTAFSFKQYATSYVESVDSFEVDFDDLTISVSLDDFVKYHFFYSDDAISVEEQFKDDDVSFEKMRDLQHDAMDDVINSEKGRELARNRKVVTRLCPDCGIEFTARATALRCKKCRNTINVRNTRNRKK